VFIVDLAPFEASVELLPPRFPALARPLFAVVNKNFLLGLLRFDSAAVRGKRKQNIRIE